MSTNWDKFDAEKALQEIDLEDDRKEKLKNTKVTVKQQEKSLEETKRKAEILATKEAMRLLRDKRNTSASANSKQLSSETEKAEIIENPLVVLTNMLTKLGNSLFSLSTNVNKLMSYSEKRIMSQQGFQQSLIAQHQYNVFIQMQILFRKAIQSIPIDNNSSSKQEMESSLQSLSQSKLFINQQILYALAYFGMHLGKYALVADCCRILINQHNQLYQQDRKYEIPFGCDINNVWLLRGFAFAAIGSTYLSHLHFKSSQSSNARTAVQGYKECCDFLANEEIKQSEKLLTQHTEERLYDEFVRAYSHWIYYESTWQKKKKFLLFIHPFTTISVKDLETLCHLSPTENADIPLKEEYFLPLSILLTFPINKPIADTSISVFPFTNTNSIAPENAEQQEQERKILFVAFALIRKLIKEAQILFLESFYSLACNKYELTKRLLENCFLSPTKNSLTTSHNINLLLSQVFPTITSMSMAQQQSLSEGFLIYLQRLYGSVLMNMALSISCKYETNQLKPSFMSFRRKTNMHKELEHAVALGNKAIEIYSHPMLLVKYIKVLEKTSRFQETLLQIDILIEQQAHKEKEHHEQMQDRVNASPELLSGLVENHHEWNSFAQLQLLDGWKSLQNFHLVEDEIDLTSFDGIEQFVKDDETLVSTLLQPSTENPTAPSGSTIVNDMKWYSKLIEELSKDMTEAEAPKALQEIFIQDEKIPSKVWTRFLTTWRKQLQYKCNRYGPS